jgi:methionine-rich copper-binding protein CopC
MRPTLVRALAACLIAVPLGLVAAGPAAAHDELVSSSPKDGADLGSAPARIVLTYSSEIEDLGATVVVTDSAGAKLAAGKPVVAGVTVTQALEPATAAGPVTVAWRVVSGDGHPISGTFGFTVAAVAAPTPSPTSSAATTASAAPSSSASSPSSPSSEQPAASSTSAPTSSAVPEPSTTLAGDASPASSPVPWIVGGLLVVGAGAAVAFGMRGRGGSSA